MEQEIMQKIALVVGRLNSIPVSGKENLTNLLGSIGLLEDIYNSIAGGALQSKTKEE